MNEQIPRKVVVINRAVPGSGKSTIARRIVAAVEGKGCRGAVHSADDFFISPAGTYDFDSARLDGNHRSCLEGFQRDVAAGVPLVICDNTNLSPWQSEPYIAAARQHGYRIVVLGFAPRELEAHVRAQIVTSEKPDAHGVPEGTLREMIKEYDDYKKLLDRSYVINPSRDVRERWNAETLSVEKTDEALCHYDVDEALEVMPDEYRRAQESIPLRILEMMGLGLPSETDRGVAPVDERG